MIYGHFAKAYDSFMRDAPYDLWVQYIDDILHGHITHANVKNDKILVVDIASGTGNITIPLAQKGYDIIGVDASEHMLAKAREKADENNLNILFLQQDMRKLDLFGTVDAALCVCDGLNYILTCDELLSVFKRVSMFLSPGGVFIFDMNTAYRFEFVSQGKTYTDSIDGASYIWGNEYDKTSCINKYSVDFYFIGDGARYTETHCQRAYPVQDVLNMLGQAGFSIIEIRDAYTSKPVSEKTWRVSFAANKNI